MKALLLAGTGPIGTELATILDRLGWDVSVTSRSHKEDKPNLTFYRGDARDRTFLDAILDQTWDLVVDFMVYSTAEFKERFERILSKCGQYIFLSSSRVYAHSEHPITEDSPRLLDVCTDETYLATDEYALSKARQEDLLHACRASNWTIIRPYITYGKDRFQLGLWEKEAWLYRSLAGRTIVVSSEINSRLTTLTDARDVASRIAALAGNPLAARQVFHITDTAPISWRKVLAIYLDAITECTGTMPKVLEVDTPTFHEIARTPYQMRYDRLYNRIFDSSRVRSATRLPDFRTPSDAIPEHLNDFITKGTFKSIDWIREGKIDAFTKELASLRELRNSRNFVNYFKMRYLKPIRNHTSK